MYIACDFLMISILLRVTDVWVKIICFFRSICIKDIICEGINIKNIYIKNICIKAADISDVFIKSTNIRAIYNQNVCIRFGFFTSTYFEAVYIGNANSIKCLKINFQFFWIFKVKFFNTWLKSGVKTYWLSLHLFWILCQPIFIVIIFEIKNAQLKFSVGTSW